MRRLPYFPANLHDAAMRIMRIYYPIFLDKSLLLSLFNEYKTQRSSEKWIEREKERD